MAIKNVIIRFICNLRVSVLRELEHRLQRTMAGGPGVFDALKKPWNSVVNLPSDTPVQTEGQGPPREDGHTTSVKVVGVDELQQNNASNRTAQSSPIASDVPSNMTPVARRSNVDVEDGGVPETPEVEIRVMLPTQVSSPRKRKRANALSPEDDVKSKALTVPVARNLLAGRGMQQDRESPALISLQAYGDLPNPLGTASPPLLPPASQPLAHASQTPEGSNQLGEGSNSDKITPRESQQEQSQHAVPQTAKSSEDDNNAE